MPLLNIADREWERVAAAVRWVEQQSAPGLRATFRPAAINENSCRCMLLGELRVSRTSKAERIVTNRKRATIEISRLFGEDHEFRLVGRGTSGILRESSSESDFASALESIGLEMLDFRYLGWRRLITVAVDSHDDLPAFSAETNKPGISIVGLMPWSLSNVRVDVEASPDAVESRFQRGRLLSRHQAFRRVYPAGVIGTATYVGGGARSFHVPHFHDLDYSRCVYVGGGFDDDDSEQRSVSAHILHIEIDPPGADAIEGYDPGGVYSGGGFPSEAVGQPCRLVPTFTYIVACNPQNAKVPSGLYMAHLAGGVWILDRPVEQNGDLGRAGQNFFAQLNG